MIQLRTVVQVADNSGARQLRVIQVYGGSKRRFGYVGDMVMASVISADPQGNIKRGDKVTAVIVRTHKEQRRTNGEYIRFDEEMFISNIKNEFLEQILFDYPNLKFLGQTAPMGSTMSDEKFLARTLLN